MTDPIVARQEKKILPAVSGSGAAAIDEEGRRRSFIDLQPARGALPARRARHGRQINVRATTARPAAGRKRTVKSNKFGVKRLW